MSETRDDLREALARWLADELFDENVGPEHYRYADAIFAGPLAQVSALQAEVERLQKVEGEREKDAGRVPDGTGLSPDGQTASRSDPSDFDPSRDRALLADLERELGVRGASAVFRKSLALAKEAAAAAREEVMLHGADLSRDGKADGPHVTCPRAEVLTLGGATADLVAKGLARQDPAPHAAAPATGNWKTLTVSARPESAAPCHWGGGNDIIWCSTCGAEYAYAKGEGRPPCPRASDEHPAGEDPKGLRAKPASAVANGDAPSDNPLTETKEGSEHV